MTATIDLTQTAAVIQIPSRGGAILAPGTPMTQPDSIAARTWGATGDCVAGALLVHGLGAHSGWFEALGRQLQCHRIFALAYDQVGFGKRRKEQFYSPEQWYQDLTTSYAYLKEIVGDKPIYVMGNSMGAAVALKVLGERRVVPEGFVMFSPGFDGHPKTFNLGYRLGAITRALLRPADEIPLPYTVDMVTRTQSVRSWIAADPERRFQPTGSMLLGVLKLSIDLKKINSVPCPLLMFSAGIDHIVDVKLAEKTFKRLKAPSKKQRHFEEAWHDLMFDPVLDQVADDIAGWIASTANLQPEKQR